MDWVKNPAAHVMLLLLALHAPRPAAAMCGFFTAPLPTGKAQVAAVKLGNTASQVVLLRKGNRTSMTLSNNYKGPAENFALVVPVPVILKKEDVRTLSPDVLKHLETLSAPRLLETWENDPCYVNRSIDVASADGGGTSGAAPPVALADPEPSVKIEAKFAAGEYEIVVLSALDSSGLERWLQANQYQIPPGAAAALAPYVREQMKFFVAKVDMSKVRRDPSGVVVLSPLRFTFDAPELRLPVRLGLLNAEGKQDLLVYILHPQKRFEAANYPNLFIHTNLEVQESVRTQFPAFYSTLFQETLRRGGDRGMVTEYVWNIDSCDTCPIQKLRPHELYLLGDDDLAPRAGQSAAPSQHPAAAARYVLTRLHTRYDRQTLSEDLIFHEAAPISGGRDGDRGNVAGPSPRDRNSFQARYTIRHYWRGPITCSTPRYRQWLRTPLDRGGYSLRRSAPPQAATNLAGAPQAAVSLQGVVRTAVPDLELPGIAAPLRRRERR